MAFVDRRFWQLLVSLSNLVDLPSLLTASSCSDPEALQNSPIFSMRVPSIHAIRSSLTMLQDWLKRIPLLPPLPVLHQLYVSPFWKLVHYG